MITLSVTFLVHLHFITTPLLTACCRLGHPLCTMAQHAGTRPAWMAEGQPLTQPALLLCGIFITKGDLT